MSRIAPFTVRNSANGGRVSASWPDGRTLPAGLGDMAKTPKHGRTAKPAVPVTGTLINVSDVPTVPAGDALSPAATEPSYVTRFRDTFGVDVTMPAWIGLIVPVIVAAHTAVTDRTAATFDAWVHALHAADPTPAPAHGHRYTGGSGADIARTQNAIYVAFAVSGIAFRDVPAAFGAAMWRFVIGPSRCAYESHTDYFMSTLSAYVAGRHNDTPGLINADAERVVRLWRDAKPEPVNSPAAS